MQQKTRFRGPLLLFSLALLTGCGYPQLGSQAAPIGRTKIVAYAPASFVPRATISGTCSSPSAVAPRKRAYRCQTAKGQILDPCFLLSDGRTAACPSNVPPYQRGTLVRLSSPAPLTSSRSPSMLSAWSLLLETGPVCTKAADTTVLGFPFACSGRGVSTGGLICRFPEGKGPLLTVMCGRPLASGRVEKPLYTHRVSTAWE